MNRYEQCIGDGVSPVHSKGFPDMSRRYTSWKPCEPTPSHAEAVALGAFSGTEDQWHQLSPGFRREIVRTFRKTAN